MSHVTVEVWDSAGRLGPLQGKISVKWSILVADVLQVTVDISHPLAPQLLDTTGGIKLVAYYNNMTFVGVNVTCVASGSRGKMPLITATAIGGRAMLDRGIVLPQLQSVQHGEIKPTAIAGTVEEIVKRTIQHSMSRLQDAPTRTTPIRKDGPKVTVVPEWQSCSEFIDEVLLESGYYLECKSWVPHPGVEPTSNLGQLCTIFDVKQYSDRPDLRWNEDDLGSWTVRKARKGISHVIVECKDDEEEEKILRVEDSTNRVPPWSAKEVRIEAPDFLSPLWIIREKEDRLKDFARSKITGVFEEQSIEVEMLAAQWDFTVEGGFYLGDIGRVILPHIGEFDLAVTQVEVTQDHGDAMVKPTLSTPSSSAVGLDEIL